MDKNTGNAFSLPLDESAYEHIQKVKQDDGYNTLGDVVSDSLRIQDALRSEKKKGFDQILVRNPRTREMRILNFPGR